MKHRAPSLVKVTLESTLSLLCKCEDPQMISSCTAQQEQLPALHLSWTQAVLGHSYWLQLELTCL